MQIASVSQLQEKKPTYDATKLPVVVPDLFNESKNKIYIEISYKAANNGTIYDSCKLDFNACLNWLVGSINTLNNTVNRINSELTSTINSVSSILNGKINDETKERIKNDKWLSGDYNEKIKQEAIARNNGDINVCDNASSNLNNERNSRIANDNYLSGCINNSNSILANCLKLNSSSTQTVSGPVVFNTELTGTILHSLHAINSDYATNSNYASNAEVAKTAYWA